MAPLESLGGEADAERARHLPSFSVMIGERVMCKIRTLGLCAVPLILVVLSLGVQADAKTQVGAPSLTKDAVTVVLETELGRIVIAADISQAPRSAQAFLDFVDAGRLSSGGFYRVVRPDNDNGSPVISVIQGGVLDPTLITVDDAIAHESTELTGIQHVNGVVSLARQAPGSASGGTFFICIDDQTALDYGQARNPDQQGFAAFGRVIEGMDVVRKINALTDTAVGVDPYVENQILSKPIRFNKVYRR